MQSPPSACGWPKLLYMAELKEAPTSGSRSFGRTVVAALVFLVAAYLLLGVIIHVVSIIFSTLLLVLAAVAVVWALKVLL